jgi:hypothetical protein
VDDLTLDWLILKVRKVFSDVISEEDDFFLQCKNKEWFDEFVDIAPGKTVSNRSILRAVFKKDSEKVCIASGVDVIGCMQPRTQVLQEDLAHIAHIAGACTGGPQKKLE